MSSTESDMDEDSIACLKRDLFTYNSDNEMENEEMFNPRTGEIIDDDLNNYIYVSEDSDDDPFQFSLRGPFCIKKMRECYKTKLSDWIEITRDELNATPNTSSKFNLYAQPIILTHESCKVDVHFEKLKSVELDLTNTPFENSNVLFFYVVLIPRLNNIQNIYIIHNDPIDTDFLYSLIHYSL